MKRGSKRPFTKSERKRIAVHEAGHALAALKMGINFGKASVKRSAHSGELAGSVDTFGTQRVRALMFDRSKGGYTLEAARRVHVERDAIVSFAGAIAEALVLGGWRVDSIAYDLSQARETLAAYYAPAAIPQVEMRLKLRTARMLDRRLVDILMLAGELLKHNELTKIEIQKLLRKPRGLNMLSDTHDKQFFKLIAAKLTLDPVPLTPPSIGKVI